MPGKAPRICPCGHTIQARQKCPCQKRGDAERKARHDRNRKTSSQRGYNGTWDRERATYLGSHPHCRFCGKTACVVDHIKPHKGNPEIFWDRNNWQVLCATCHNSTKQAQERRNMKGM